MVRYLGVVKGLFAKFLSWAIDKISGIENIEADKLSRFASITIPEPNLEDKEKKVLVEYLLG